ncbi:DDE superfamily endonuclease-domain-containing protein [Xylaria intraflava]|nr:DDE superfamily endonuclease-domain-containing protein [Xylaria intraflava]
MSDPIHGLSHRRFQVNNIINLDETPLPFEFLEGYTYEHTGSKSVNAKSIRSGWDKRQATLVLSIVADGSTPEELKPIVIFHGKGNVVATEGHRYHPGVTVRFNEKAYNNEGLLEEWIKTSLASYTRKKNSLLVIDAAAFHKTAGIKAALAENNVVSALVPPGLTAYLQPLDVGFNGPFKKWLKEETDLYIDRLEEENQLPERWSIGERRVMATIVVGEAWKRASTPENQAMVRGLFQKTGISIHPSGKEDHLIHIKGLESIADLHLDDYYRLPEDIDLRDIYEDLSDQDEFDFRDIHLRNNTYRRQTVAELKNMCRNRGLRVGGNKADLIHRLEDADAAQIASEEDQEEDEEVDEGPLPPPLG